MPNLINNGLLIFLTYNKSALWALVSWFIFLGERSQLCYFSAVFQISDHKETWIIMKIQLWGYFLSIQWDLDINYKDLVFCRNNGRLMENIDKGLTVPKWVLINQPKVPQMPQNLSAQIVCPSQKDQDFDEKSLHWVSVVCDINHMVVESSTVQSQAETRLGQ